MAGCLTFEIPSLVVSSIHDIFKCITFKALEGKNGSVLSSKPEGTIYIVMAECVNGDTLTVEIKHSED